MMSSASHRLIVVASFATSVTMMSGCALATNVSTPDAALEDIYLLRSIREQRAPIIDWCASSKTRFEPFSTDAERSFSFWSVNTRLEDGKVIDARHTRVAELRGCFGPTQDRARQNFYAEIPPTTMTSGARFGGDTEPSGYTQASIATIRLWKESPRRQK